MPFCKSLPHLSSYSVHAKPCYYHVCNRHKAVSDQLLDALIELFYAAKYKAPQSVLMDVCALIDAMPRPDASTTASISRLDAVRKRESYECEKIRILSFFFCLIQVEKVLSECKMLSERPEKKEEKKPEVMVISQEEKIIQGILQFAKYL